MKKILLLLFCFLFLCGCSQNLSNQKIDKMTEIKELMGQEEYIIVDVRTKEEYEEGHLLDAINIPVDQILESDLSKDKMIFVYCKSGNRSNNAYQTLKKLGYRVYDMGAYSAIDLPKV